MYPNANSCEAPPASVTTIEPVAASGFAIPHSSARWLLPLAVEPRNVSASPLKVTEETAGVLPRSWSIPTMTSRPRLLPAQVTFASVSWLTGVPSAVLAPPELPTTGTAI
jgi:hypothetical protein